MSALYAFTRFHEKNCNFRNSECTCGRDAAAAELEALQERVRVLEEALRPFAKVADWWNEGDPQVWASSNKVMKLIDFADFRRAAAALEQP